MADRDTLDAIKKRDATRAQTFDDIVAGACAAMQNFDSDELRTALGQALDFLVEDYRATAELYLNGRIRGATSTAKELRTVAAAMALLAKQLRELDGASMPAAPPSTAERQADAAEGIDIGPKLADNPCDDYGKTEHAPHNYFRKIEHPSGEDEAYEAKQYFCRGFAQRDISGLKILIDERAGRDPVVIDHGALQVQADAAKLIEEISSMQFDEPSPVPPELDLGVSGIDERGGATAAFDEPSLPGAGLRSPGGTILTWARLRELQSRPSLSGLPGHLSHSQIETLTDCGAKYLMQRSETLGVQQVPQWANVGGNGFHRAVEWFEHEVIAAQQNRQYVTDRLNAAGGVASVWGKWFGQEITDVQIEHPWCSMNDWRASKKGAENYTWWLINGEEMLGRYVSMRLAELEQGRSWRVINYAATDDGPAPMLEHETIMDVEGIPYKGVIDQVWMVITEHDGMRVGDLLIDDLKSGASAPDEAQLREYALWLSRFGGGEDRTIWGRFYDARKGAYSEPVDLLAGATEDGGSEAWEELAFKVEHADRVKRSGSFMPRKSPFCNGCAVKHACPIFATKAPA